MTVKKLNLKDFEEFKVASTNHLQGGARITGSGVGTVDIEWDNGDIDCDKSTQEIWGHGGWDGSGNDPYVGHEF
jgi:hypothetical protein